MESILPWFAVIVGGLGTAAGYAFSFLAGRGAPDDSTVAEERAERRRTATALIIALVIAAILFGLSWIKRPVIAELNGSACSFLFGVLMAAIVAAFYTGAGQRWRRDMAKPETRGSLMGGAGVWLLSAAVFIVALTNIIFRKDPTTALLGCALGVTYIAGVLSVAVMMGADKGRSWVGFWGVTLTVIVLSLANVLARLHFSGEENAAWWGVPLGLAAAAIVGATIATRICAIPQISRNDVVSFWVTALVTFIVSAGMAALVAMRVAMEWRFLWLYLCSGGAFLLISYAVWRAGRDRESVGIEGAAAAAMLLLFLIVISFRMFGAFGTSIAALAGLCFVILPMGALAILVDESPLRKVSASVVAAITMAAGFLVFRVFMERFVSTVRGIDLDMHYTFIGLMLGTLLPLILDEMSQRTPNLFTRGAWRAVRRGLFMWLMVVGIVTGVTAIWGLKALMGVVAGIVVTYGIRFAISAAHRSEQHAVSGSPFTFGILLLAVQFGGLAAQFQTISRTQKAWIIIVIAALAGLWLIISSFGRRRSA